MAGFDVFPDVHVRHVDKPRKGGRWLVRLFGKSASHHRWLSDGDNWRLCHVIRAGSLFKFYDSLEEDGNGHLSGKDLLGTVQIDPAHTHMEEVKDAGAEDDLLRLTVNGRDILLRQLDPEKNELLLDAYTKAASQLERERTAFDMYARSCRERPMSDATIELRTLFNEGKITREEFEEMVLQHDEWGSSQSGSSEADAFNRFMSDSDSSSIGEHFVVRANCDRCEAPFVMSSSTAQGAVRFCENCGAKLRLPHF